jgi:catechol 2,3-dioxygenase-like lactoylglutathione lyase family enzyme
MALPSGTEAIRAFLPTTDFDLSKRFYEALGFEKVLDADVAIFNAGSGGFLLQRPNGEPPPENLMMQLMVDDVNAWWTHVQGLDLSKRFGVRAPQAPAMQPWGLLVLYVVDPAGVLWHIAQRRDGVVHDK